MTNESLRTLNTTTLIGMVEERGPAWHRRDDLQGDEDNHYPRFIPVKDVKRRLFNWQPNTVGVAYLVPAQMGQATDPMQLVVINDITYRVVPSQQGRVGVLRNDNDYDMGVFMGGVVHPPYQVSLIQRVEQLMGESLGISSAGLLARGARAWVEMSMPTTRHDERSGFDYRPNFLAATSMDGSLSHTDALTVTATVCDNTLKWNLLEARQAGRLFKRKHTSLSMGDLQEERDVLGILEQVDEEFIRELHSLMEIELTRPQRIEVMDILLPLPSDEGRAYTLAENKRSQLLALDNDPMVSQWVGTALGELQRYNTYEHHYSNIKNTGRSERNMWRALNGKQAEADTAVIRAIEKVVSAA
jgi:phage/plasmid-like protein (TIGR03299 family)